MALATVDDVGKTMQTALGRQLTQDEASNLDAGDLLDQASDLVTGYLYPWPVPLPVPGPIVRVVAMMVVSVLTRPSQILPNSQQLNADIYGVTFEAGTTNPGPYLTAALKQRLAPYRNDNGMSEIGLITELFDDTTQTVPDLTGDSDLD